MRSLAIIVLVLLGGCLLRADAGAGLPGLWLDSSMGLLQGELTARFGPDQRPRIQRGLAQVARYWRSQDGGAGEFEAFVRAQYAGAPGDRDALFGRLERLVAGLDGQPQERRLDSGPKRRALPIDAVLAGPPEPPGDQLALAVLLNFPLTTLAERIRDGGSWTSRQWAEAWLAERLSRNGQDQAGAACAGGTRRMPGQAGCQALLQAFQAARRRDPGSPSASTQFQRSFDQDLQLPEARVRDLLEAVCGSPLAARAARLVRARLGRALEPLDLDYDGFRSGGEARFRKRWPTAEACGQALPGLLLALGFAPANAAWLAADVPARTAPVAHTGGGVRALGTTGRALAQDLPRHEAEFPSLAGVPAPPFGEALALVFQARALRILAREPAGKARDLAALDGFWRAYAGAGAAMVETAAWHWLYDHPGAAAAELETAIAASARAVWNRYYAPVFGRKDCLVLAGGLPTQGGLQRSGCPIGMLIAFQLQREIDRSGKPGATLERCARLGRLTPDLWLLRATGTPLGPGALLEATATALRDLGN